MGKGGFPGGGFGGGNMQQILKQAQKMQADMQRAQEELKNSEVTGSAAGGMVEITMRRYGMHIRAKRKKVPAGANGGTLARSHGVS